ncbi:MAG: PepSY domain-containing protein [Planctomycetota bacterium]
MRTFHFVIGLVLICTMGCASLESTHEEEKEIPLSQVPAEAVEAAQQAVAGITLTEAEVEEEDGCTVYELEGTADGIEYEIEVTADGKVLEVEQEDEDDEEDDDDEHDDDD